MDCKHGLGKTSASMQQTQSLGKERDFKSPAQKWYSKCWQWKHFYLKNTVIRVLATIMQISAGFFKLYIHLFTLFQAKKKKKNTCLDVRSSLEKEFLFFGELHYCWMISWFEDTRNCLLRISEIKSRQVCGERHDKKKWWAGFLY